MFLASGIDEKLINAIKCGDMKSANSLFNSWRSENDQSKKSFGSQRLKGTLKKKCPVPGCFAEVVNLPRHMRSSKKPGHNMDRATSAKVSSIFCLRKEMTKLTQTKRPRRKKLYYQCSVAGCLSIVINISDHFKKVHSSIFADTEQYARLRKGLTRLLPDDFPVMSVRKVSATQENADSDDSTGSDEPCDLATNNADSASLEMRKFLVHNDMEETTDDTGSDFSEQESGSETEDEFEYEANETDGSTGSVLEAFMRYLVNFEGGKKSRKATLQCCNQVKAMLKCVDPDMNSFDNLFNVELLRDKWLTWAHAPGRGKLSGRGHLPGTLRSYLGSLCKFVQFLIREKTAPWCGKLVLYCAVKVEVMHIFLEELKNWSASFNDEVDVREWEVMEENLENIITPEEFTEVYQSDASAEARKLLEQYQLEDGLVTRESFVLVRDYLAGISCLRNAGRAGNCINLTLGEFLGGKIDSTTRDIIINVKNHKTKRKYGPAQIVLTAVLYRQMRSYLSIYRSDVAKMNSCDALDPSINFFVTWSFKPLKGFSKQLNSFWRKALKTNRECPISATLARKSVTTMFYAKEDTTDILKSQLANHMKHKPETAAKNYNLIKTMKNSAELVNQIDKEIFHCEKPNGGEGAADNYPLPVAEETNVIDQNDGTYRSANNSNVIDFVNSTEMEDKDQEESETTRKRKSFNDDSSIASGEERDSVAVKSLKIEHNRGWTEKQIKEVNRLFGSYNFGSVYIPTIRSMIKDNLLLKEKTPKAIYDKLISLKTRKSTEISTMKIKPMSDFDKKTICRLFKCYITTNKTLTQSVVKETLIKSQAGLELLENYSIERLLNKVRYERSRR